MEAQANRRLKNIAAHINGSRSTINAQPVSGANANATQVIVIGGGLSGLSAAHTVLERGGRVLLLDKNSFLGGNSTKATSGINAALTRTQIAQHIPDSVAQFEEDTALAASGGKSTVIHPLGKVLVGESAPAVEWLIDAFGLDLSILGTLGGQKYPRTHRGKEKFPGMTITYALMEKLEEIEKTSGRARIITKARATRLLTDVNGGVIGCEYEVDGKTVTAHGPVVISTGGFAADFGKDSILGQVHPEWLHLPTTNGDHCTGDGIKIATSIGALTKDIDYVQIHPTGLVHPDDPDARVKWLAAEALRGAGGILLDRDGKRFYNELGRRDQVTGAMWNLNKAPYRLVLNSTSSKDIEWHCKHYAGRGLMKHYKNSDEFAKDCGMDVKVLNQTLNDYEKICQSKNDPIGKPGQHLKGSPWKPNDSFNVAIVTPVLHYCMGGLMCDTNAQVISETGPIEGLYASGEVVGGIHGAQRLGGSSLLDCVVFGRVAGRAVSNYLMSEFLDNKSESSTGSNSPVNINLAQRPGGVTLDLTFDAQKGPAQVKKQPAKPKIYSQEPLQSRSSLPPPPKDTRPAQSAPVSTPAPSTTATTSTATSTRPPNGEKRAYTAEEVAQHKTEKDCWVVVNEEVLDVTKFLPDHPGGKKAILLYAGKDASEEFNMLHDKNVVAKYAPDSIIGTLKK